MSAALTCWQAWPQLQGRRRQLPRGAIRVVLARAFVRVPSPRRREDPGRPGAGPPCPHRAGDLAYAAPATQPHMKHPSASIRAGTVIDDYYATALHGLYSAIPIAARALKLNTASTGT